MDFTKLIEGEFDETLIDFLKNPMINIPNIKKTIEIARDYNIAIHPKYLFYWNELAVSELIIFLNNLKNIKFDFNKDNLISSTIENNDFKRTFEILGIEHTLKTNSISQVKDESSINQLVFNKLNTESLLCNLGIYVFDYNNFNELKTNFLKQLDKIISFAKDNLEENSCFILTNCNELEIRDKGGSYIGARMGRPEKAKMRKQFNSETKSHALFPVGEGLISTTKVLDSDEEREELIPNRTKNLVDAINTGFVVEDFRGFYCTNCDEDTIYEKCERCGNICEQQFYEKYGGVQLPSETETSVFYKKRKINLTSYDRELRNILGPDTAYPKHVKGITSTINKHHTVEHISKGFLRALNNVFVNKDGTVRFDMIEMGLTHFKPMEIGTSIEKLKELGYTHDMDGEVLTNVNQLVEIMPQDVILPDCAQSGDEFASDYVINTGNYVDDLLEKLYKLPRFYNFKKKEDTVGHLIIGLAPHTSAGIVGRILGYSKTQGCFSHPVWHAAQRRNLDGDENGIMLLVDGLINFSREYLPDRRGSRTMDVSLVLTSHLYLDQIDDEVHGMDIVPFYPLEFYRKNKEYISPKAIKIEKVNNRIESKKWDDKYFGYKFTHTTSDMNDTILCSSYKYVPSMKEKLELQLALAEKIRAVDEDRVGTLIIDKHFMKDIKGNLRKFGMQNFRCTKCNTSYRRPPLCGKCTHCSNPSINFTISEGSVKKYVQHSFNIIKKYNVDPYIAESVELTNLRIEGVFGKDLEKQKSLNTFFTK